MHEVERYTSSSTDEFKINASRLEQNSRQMQNVATARRCVLA